ncbi:MAG: phosphate propanoyltransferase [Firmicutes bacterium]|nr:phosphate propanoyltransferase [Bacillota bacterium]
MSNMMLPVAISNRHVHLSQADLEVLFGKGFELTKMKDLSQPGQFAANEQVDLVGPKRTISGVRILGPARKTTQAEISVTDAFTLGVAPVLRNSGDLEGTPGIKLVGPAGEVVLDKGCIVASRHIHMHTSDAENFDVKDKDIVSIRTGGPRPVVFENVLVRVHPEYALEMHVDTDEGNAALLRNGTMVELIK